MALFPLFGNGAVVPGLRPGEALIRPSSNMSPQQTALFYDQQRRIKAAAGGAARTPTADARTPFAQQDITSELDRQGYQRGTVTQQTEWAYPDRSIILPALVRSAASQMGLSNRKANAPERFDKAAAMLTRAANDRLKVKKAVRRVIV